MMSQNFSNFPQQAPQNEAPPMLIAHFQVNELKALDTLQGGEIFDEETGLPEYSHLSTVFQNPEIRNLFEVGKDRLAEEGLLQEDNSQAHPALKRFASQIDQTLPAYQEPQGLSEEGELYKEEGIDGDTQLALMPMDVLDFFDSLRGKVVTNPKTGLPMYADGKSSMFSTLLSALVPAAVGALMGGPAAGILGGIGGYMGNKWWNKNHGSDRRDPNIVNESDVGRVRDATPEEIQRLGLDSELNNPKQGEPMPSQEVPTAQPQGMTQPPEAPGIDLKSIRKTNQANAKEDVLPQKGEAPAEAFYAPPADAPNFHAIPKKSLLESFKHTLARPGTLSLPESPDPMFGYKKGGKIEGQAIHEKAPLMKTAIIKGPGKGQDDVIKTSVPDGSYIIDATTTSMLGDGSSEAGARALDEFFGNLRALRSVPVGHKEKMAARGASIRSQVKRQAYKTQRQAVPVLLSNDEYHVDPEDVELLGNGKNSIGSKMLKQMVKNIRRHKNSKGDGLPPKAKLPTDYLKGLRENGIF